MPSDYQKVASDLARIANERARILSATEYDLPDELSNAIADAESEFNDDPANEDNYFEDDVIREKFAEKYLDKELPKLATKAEKLGIVLDFALVRALIKEIGSVTHWQSSSYGC